MALQPAYERIAVARPVDANTGPVRARVPRQVAEMRRLRRGGASMDAIAIAYGVSKRTVYRYLAEDVVETTVELDGWRATFARAPGRAPWRVSAWRTGLSWCPVPVPPSPPETPRASGLAGRRLADQYGLSIGHIARIRATGPRMPTRRERYELEVIGGTWAAACMEPDEWADWVRDNPRLNDATFADRPCRDCPLGFAAEMRAIGRCNGSPGAVGGRHEAADEEEGEDEGPMLNQNERTTGGIRGQALELVPPPCETCLHEPICVLKIALGKAKSADVVTVPLPDGLSVVVTAKVDCRFYNAAKKPGRKLNLSDEERARRGAQARLNTAAKLARAEAES